MIASAGFSKPQRPDSLLAQMRVDLTYLWMVWQQRTQDEKVDFLHRRHDWTLSDIERCSHVLSGDLTLVSPDAIAGAVSGYRFHCFVALL